jgi:hypothetical protein
MYFAKRRTKEKIGVFVQRLYASSWQVSTWPGLYHDGLHKWLGIMFFDQSSDIFWACFLSEYF